MKLPEEKGTVLVTGSAGHLGDALVRTGVHAVVHAASLHKPHVSTHSRQAFVDANVTGTLVLLEEAASAGVQAFVYTSTTSVFSGTLTTATGAPAAWITDSVVPVAKNITVFEEGPYPVAP